MVLTGMHLTKPVAIYVKITLSWSCESWFCTSSSHGTRDSGDCYLTCICIHKYAIENAKQRVKIGEDWGMRLSLTTNMALEDVLQHFYVGWRNGCRN